MKIEEESFELTKSQIVLKSKMEKFLESSERIFLLIGKPGVGKTTMSKITLAKHIKRDVESNASGQDISVAGISLSHQAKNVLGEHIPNVFTFAKAYGMKEVRHDDGSRSFEIDKYNKSIVVGELNIPVFIHDEVSQYTPEMLKIVLEKTSMYSKIIFMGDKAQLPPIDPEKKMLPDQDSPVFDLDIPESCRHELTERVRQAEGNPILELSDVIREEIFGNQNIRKVLDIIKVPNIKDNVGYDIVKYDDITEHMKDKDNMQFALIGFRNAKCIDFFNLKLRTHFLNNPTDRIVKGDIICMTNNYYADDGLGGKYCVFNNSDVFKITDVITAKVKCNVGDKVYYIDCFKAKTSVDKKSVFICPTDNGMVDYQNALNEVSELCRKRQMRWDDFWDFFDYFCRFNYAYAITAYKAQGSTYKTVYVDINDILMTKPLTPKRKLQTIYTAITRAKYDVYFLKKH